MTNEHISINSEFEKAINELNIEIEKVELEQKDVPILSSLYKYYTEKELELQKKKLQLIKNRSDELMKIENQDKSPTTRIIEALDKATDKGYAGDIYILVKSLGNLLYSADLDSPYFTEEEYELIENIISKLEGEVLTYTLSNLSYDAVEELTDSIGKLKAFK